MDALLLCEQARARAARRRCGRRRRNRVRGHTHSGPLVVEFWLRGGDSRDVRLEMTSGSGDRSSGPALERPVFVSGLARGTGAGRRRVSASAGPRSGSGRAALNVAPSASTCSSEPTRRRLLRHTSGLRREIPGESRLAPRTRSSTGRFDDGCHVGRSALVDSYVLAARTAVEHDRRSANGTSSISGDTGRHVQGSSAWRRTFSRIVTPPANRAARARQSSAHRLCRAARSVAQSYVPVFPATGRQATLRRDAV
jgi:hypothetical protein